MHFCACGRPTAEEAGQSTYNNRGLMVTLDVHFVPPRARWNTTRADPVRGTNGPDGHWPRKGDHVRWHGEGQTQLYAHPPCCQVTEIWVDVLKGGPELRHFVRQARANRDLVDRQLALAASASSSAVAQPKALADAAPPGRVFPLLVGLPRPVGSPPPRRSPPRRVAAWVLLHHHDASGRSLRLRRPRGSASRLCRLQCRQQTR